MKLNKKALIFSGLIVLALGLGIVTNRALAQDTNPGDQTTTTNQAAPGAQTAPADQAEIQGRIGKGGRGGLGSTAELEAAATALGMTSDELKTQLQAGAILADLADKAGVDLQRLRDAVETARLDELKANIAQAVTDGKITQAEADWQLKGLETGYTPGLGKGLLNPKGDMRAAELESAAKALGATAQDLENQLWAGRALSAIAEKAGVDLQTVTDAMTAARTTSATQQIEQALANGTITQEQADWLLEGVQNGYGRMGKGFGDGGAKTAPNGGFELGGHGGHRGGGGL
jgi:hypothetical protein